jgi:hypothetical protein
MATAKKSKKTTDRTTTSKKKPAPKRAATKKKRSVERPLLTDEAKTRLVRPPTEYPALVERSLAQWEENKSTLKVANSSPATLRGMLRAARKARAKEEAVRAQFEKKLAPLADARLLAEDAVWRQTLDLYAVAKAQGRVLPQLIEAFAFLADVYKRTTKSEEPPKPSE